MKLKNRFLACTTALFLFCSLTAAPVLAADQPAVALSSADAKAGDTVKLTVSLRDFSKAADPDGAKAGKPIDGLFSALQLKVYYDADVFTPAAYGLTDERAGKPSPVKLDGDWAADLVKRSDAGGDYLYCGVLCLSGDGARLSDDQAVLDLTLQVKADAPSGDYALKTVIDTVVTGIQGDPKNVGGQFTVQGPLIVEAARQIDGANLVNCLNAFVYGDECTNLLQPLYVIPALSVVGMKLKDVWGFMAFICMFWLVIVCLGLYFIPMFV